LPREWATPPAATESGGLPRAGAPQDDELDEGDPDEDTLEGEGTGG
jgi:hypothetical protein